MSDDTPTRRYPDGFSPSGGAGGDGTVSDAPTEPFNEPPSPVADAPTERLGAPAAPAAHAPAAPVPGAVPPAPPSGTVPPEPEAASGDRRNQRGLIIALSIIAGILLLALIGVLIWLALNSRTPVVEPSGSPTPSPSASQSESPEPEPSPTPTQTEEPPPPPPPPPADAISSYTASATQVDCTAAGGTSVPVTFSWAATGTMLWFGIGTDDAHANPYGEFPLNYTMDVDYQCGQPGQQQRYTITVQRDDGTYESRTVVIREV